MNINAEKYILEDCAQISACYPFRGKIEEKPGSGTHVIQLKDVDWEEGIDWSGCIETKLTGKKSPEWLKVGDILFVAKGLKNYALLVDEGLGDRKAVASTQFFKIRITNENLSPAFLVWWLNHGYSQSLFKTYAHGIGTASQNLPKSLLGRAEIVIPAAKTQKTVTDLYGKIFQERLAAQALIDKGRAMMGILACDIMDSSKR